MYKILKIEGDTVLLGDEDKKILTVSKADFGYDNPEIGDVVQVFKNDESILVIKTESVQRQVSEIAPQNKNVLEESGRSAKTNRGAKPLYKKPWFIVMMVILVLGVIGSFVG